MLKRKPSFATFWLPIAAVSFAHLMFPGAASANTITMTPSAALAPGQQPTSTIAVSASRNKKRSSQPADAPGGAPDGNSAPSAPNNNDVEGFMTLDQARAAIPSLDLEFNRGNQTLVIHGSIPAACADNLVIRNSDTDPKEIKAAPGTGGIAIYNKGGLLDCVKSHPACTGGSAVVARSCVSLSSRPDAQMNLQNLTRGYDYLNIDFGTDKIVNANIAGLHTFHLVSGADAQATLESRLVSNIQNCIDKGDLNSADSLISNNSTMLGDMMQVLQDKVTKAEIRKAGKDADNLVSKIKKVADNDDFDYDKANEDIFAFLDDSDHPEHKALGDKFAQLVISLAGDHAKNGSTSDVAAAKLNLQTLLGNSDYNLSSKNHKDVDRALTQGIPLAEDHAELSKDVDLAQRGNSGPLAKFMTNDAKKIQKLEDKYQKKCASTSDKEDKSGSQACSDMMDQIIAMQQMPQQVMMQAQQAKIAQQQTIAQMNQGMMQAQQSSVSQQFSGMGTQGNPACTYNPTACMSNPYSYSGSYSGMNSGAPIASMPATMNGAYAPSMYNNTGISALQSSTISPFSLSSGVH